jgi:hypothetical protein
MQFPNRKLLILNKSKHTKQKKYIKDNPDYFEYKDEVHLRISDKFLPHVLKTFDNFFLQIQTALEKKYAEHKSR